MIRIHWDDLDNAKASADVLLRERGHKVAVYRAAIKKGFVVLDAAGCRFEESVQALNVYLEDRRVYNPERRRTPRAPLRVPVEVTVVKSARA
ncbi:MAG: hypothetical protein V3T08_09780 [Gemmatimonadota bacterium]